MTDNEIIKTLKCCLECGAKSVKMGEWVQADGGKTICSNCGTKAVYQTVNGRWEYENFCPHCGLEMTWKGKEAVKAWNRGLLK